MPQRKPKPTFTDQEGDGKRVAKDYRQLLRLLSDSVKLVRETSGKLVILIVVLRVVSGLTTGAMLLLGRNAVVALTNPGQAGLVSALGVLGIVYLASTICGMVASELETFVGAKVQRRTMDNVLNVATAVRLEAFEAPHFFDHLKRVETNALTEPAKVVRILLQLPATLAGAGGVVAALLFLQPLLVPLVLLSIVPLHFITRLNARRAFEFAKDRVHGDRRRDYLRSLLTGKDEAKEMRAFGAGAELRRRYDKLYEEYLDQLRRFRRKQSIVRLVASVATLVIVGFWAVFLGLLFSSGRTSGANLGAGAMAVPLLTGRVFLFVQLIGDLYTSALFIEDYRAFLELKPELKIVPPPSPAPAVAGFQELTVQNLHFTYPGASDEALRGIDLKIRAGQVVALVGENGSGKTTLAKLLANLYRPVAGQIAWDGLDMRTLSPEFVQKQISIVFQDFVRYQLSVADNIGLGLPDAAHDREGIEQAGSQANLDEIVNTFENGYDTVLSKPFGGIDLSIGQWQRVAIARAFFRNAPFLILDEPTAALDARAEHALFETIRQLRKDRTVLLISHRFSTVRSADMIYVLKRGVIVEAGTHAELCRSRGLYAELYNLQITTSLSSSAVGA